MEGMPFTVRIYAVQLVKYRIFVIRMDNGAMENFFGRLKVEMFYGEQFESVEDFIHALDEYIYYYNNERISLKLKGMSPVQYRTHSKVS